MSFAGWHKVHGAGRHREVKKEWIETTLSLSRKCQTILSVLDLFVLMFALFTLMLLLCLEIEHELKVFFAFGDDLIWALCGLLVLTGNQSILEIC